MVFDIGVKNAYNAIVLQENKNFNEPCDLLEQQGQGSNESDSELKLKTLPLTCSKETKEI